MNEEKYHVTIDSKGVFSYYSNSTPLVLEDLDAMNSYCIEHAEKNDMSDYYIFKCFGDPEPQVHFQYKFYAFILSCIFLVLTIAVYIILNEVRKVFGKILVLYCIAMLFESGTLAYAASAKTPDETDCQIICKEHNEIFIYTKYTNVCIVL